MSRGAQGGNAEGTYDLLWIICAGMAIALITWFYGGPYFIPIIYKIKSYEIMGINFFIEHWNTLAIKTSVLPVISGNELFKLQLNIERQTVSMNYRAVGDALKQVGSYTRFLFCPIMLALAVWIYYKNVTLKMRNVFSMNSMKMLEQNNWPQIAPVVKLNLVKEDIHKGPWAMSMTPMQFSKHHQLLEERRDETGRVTVELLKPEAQQVFVLQLGGLLTSIEALPLYMKALFAVFAACANQDRDAALKLLQQIDVSFSAGKINFDGAMDLLKKHFRSKPVQKLLQKHAYIFTIMASMLELARTDGVLATSEFLWLKVVNRRLWYVLNGVGRQTPFPEAAGVFAHWMAEKKWGGALRTPMVEEAVKALEIALSEIIYEPEEE